MLQDGAIQMMISDDDLTNRGVESQDQFSSLNGLSYVLHAAKKDNDDFDDEDDFNDDDDYYNDDDEDDKDNPFEREPDDDDLTDDVIPLEDPEEDLTDDDDYPY